MLINTGRSHLQRELNDLSINTISLYALFLLNRTHYSKKATLPAFERFTVFGSWNGRTICDVENDSLNEGQYEKNHPTHHTYTGAFYLQHVLHSNVSILIFFLLQLLDDILIALAFKTNDTILYFQSYMDFTTTLTHLYSDQLFPTSTPTQPQYNAKTC